MLSLIEAYHYRCLKYVRQPLDPMHILVGPNASGKTTFLDVVTFLGDLVSQGLDEAITARTSNFADLVWQHGESGFGLAVEARIPDSLSQVIARGYDTIRYEVAIGLDGAANTAVIEHEKVLLRFSSTEGAVQRELFPIEPALPAAGVITRGGRRGERSVITKVPNGNDNYYSEVDQDSGKGWMPAFRLGPRRSALANLPADETKFPATVWLRTLLTEGVQSITLNSLLLRRASPPGQGRGFRPDGSNLPWVIEDLRTREGERFRQWLRHLQTALPDLVDVSTVERQDDRHRYVVLHYQEGLQVPSWVASDGTLRLLALTLPAYLPHPLQGLYLIEEPENGIHPRAVETLFQSLSSVYDAQILLATHSTVILSMAKPAQVLCFAKTPGGATDIVRGDQHPNLRDWQGETDLGTLFGAGVLG